jgi:6-phosphofructokinase 1
MQRGGVPCARDRIIASMFGVHAFKLAQEKKFNRMVAWNGHEVVDVPLDSVFGKQNKLSQQDQILKVARDLGIYVGEI